VAIASAAAPAHPSHRIAAVVGVLAAASLVWGPAEGTGRAPFGALLSGAGGLLLAPVVVALVYGTPPGEALAAGFVLGGFFLFLGGLSAALRQLTSFPLVGMAGAALLGVLAVSSFHLGDPFLEWGGVGAPSRTALFVLHAVNPLCGAIGDGLNVDWLRLPIMYSGFPGTVSGELSAAQYYQWSYPGYWAQAFGFAALGLSLLALAYRLAFRFPRTRAGA
jgi:hypothetical protein